MSQKAQRFKRDYFHERPCPYCREKMSIGATACRDCWRRGKGSHRTGGHSVLTIILKASAMNPRIGQTVNVDGFKIKRTAEGFQLGG
jgi:hypothetical protein